MGRKSSVINLTADEREYLETQTRARTIQAQTVNRARILLLKADGCSIDNIADKVGINRKSVMLCLSKYKEGGVENALFDTPGRGRNAEITDEKKAWIINMACQKPKDLGYSAETVILTLIAKCIMSNNKMHHSSSKHIPRNYAQQIYHKLLKGLEVKEDDIITFFNKFWSNSDIEDAINYGRNEAIKQGITDGQLEIMYTKARK